MRGGGGEGKREAEHLVSVSLAGLLQLVGEEGGGKGEGVLHGELQGAGEHGRQTSNLVAKLHHKGTGAHSRGSQVEGHLDMGKYLLG